jgi:hypothetical protein
MRLKPAWYVPVVRNLFRGDADRGVGDTLARELGGPKSEPFKRHHETVFGIWAAPCNCTDKIRQLNRLYPYPSPVEDPQSVSTP